MRLLEGIMRLFGFRVRRRTLFRLSISSLLLYAVSGILGLSARAAGTPRIWRINASSYATGIERFFKLVHSSASPGNNFPVSSLLWYFPLNPMQPDGFQRLIDRGQVSFDSAKATSQAKYDSLDFKDDAIGNVSVILHEKLTADYKTDATSVTFVFQEPLPQVVIWKIPVELGMPKSLRVASITLAATTTDIVLSNTVNTDILRIALFVDSPSSVGADMRVKFVSMNRLGATEALSLLAQNSTICCQGNCYRDDGTVGSETEVLRRWGIFKRIVPPNSGTCSVSETTNRESWPPEMNYILIADGFTSIAAASEAMNTKFKDKCTPSP